MASSRFHRSCRIAVSLVFSAATAFCQWRTGYFVEQNTVGQTAGSIPWSKYSHVVHSAVRPSVADNLCSLNLDDEAISRNSIDSFVSHAHRAGAKAIIGVAQDPSGDAMRWCTTPSNLARFVALISAFVRQNAYDGVDIAWRVGADENEQQTNYRFLVNALRTAMPTAILTLQTPTADISLAASVSAAVDQINLMAHGVDFEDVPPYRMPTRSNAVGNLIDRFSTAGALSKKLGFGLAFYGWVERGCLESTGTVGVGEPRQTALDGISSLQIPYRDLIASRYWSAGTHVWDVLDQSQYIRYTGGTCSTDAYVTYAGVEQIQAATQKIQAGNFGGIAAWDLSSEYDPQIQGDAQYPLSSAIANAMSPERYHPSPSSSTSNASPARRIADVTLGADAVITYYVDSVKGSDSNAGTMAAPWRTVAKVNAVKLSPGQSVGFSRGGIWREELDYSSSGTAANPIVYTAYGSGASPILSGSNLIASGWQKDSGHVWKATVPVQPNIVYFNGTRGTLVSSKGAIRSEFQCSWASGVLYVWSPSGADPSTYYTAPGIESGARGRVIQTGDKSYVTMDGLTVRDGNTLADGMINVGSTSVVGIAFTNCMVERGATMAFNLKGSTNAVSVTIDNCAIRDNGGYAISLTNQFSTVVISNNTIAGNGWASVRDNQEYSSIAGTLGNAQIFGNSIYANDPACKNGGSIGLYCHGIYYVSASAATVDIHDNKIHDMTTGSGVKVIGSAIVHHNTIYNNGLNGVQLGQNGTTAVAYLVYSNLIYGNNTANGTGAGISEYNGGTGTIQLTIENNTLFNNGNTTGYEIQIVDQPSQLTVYNNLMYASPTRRTLGIARALAASAAIDYNLHWRDDGNAAIAYNGSYPTFVQWQTLGFDVHGMQANPLLTQPTNDFSLLPGSPAIGRGIPIAGIGASNIGAF